MQLNRLTLTHLRAFDQAELTFQPGMNLIVGINGVGKSTILDTLRVMLSQVLPKLSRSRSPVLEFEQSDISLHQQALTATLTYEVAGIQFSYLVHESLDQYIISKTQPGQVRDQAYEAVERHDLTPSETEIPKSLKNADEQPLAIYFSTRRALPNDKASKKRKAGPTAAFFDALEHRELRLMEFADWWLAQTALAAEGVSLAQQHLDTLAKAVTGLLDTCSNVRADRRAFVFQDKEGIEKKIESTTLLINKGNTPFDVRYLSDGERGMLALVLDLARRLSQANPKLQDPLKQGKAVVLIDEIDLHLHPRWQRTIVKKLTDTFPNCQFIATTHSPLVIGEVESEKIILLEAGQPPFRPDQALGMDADWILKYLMGTTTRNIPTENELKRIAKLIDQEEYDPATDAIDALRDSLGEFPELVRLQARIDRFQLLAE